MTALVFTVPAEFSNRLVYERVGALIKETATGKIAGHIQELSGWGLVSHLPIPGANPLELVTDGIQMAQLAGIRRTLDTVQTLATVGAVASVASLGVSVGGFAIVISKLNRMDRKLDRLLSETARVRHLVQSLHVKLDALAMAELRSALEELELASLYEPARREQALHRSIGTLSILRHYYATLLAEPQFCALGTDSLLALLDTHERLVAASGGELFAEFLLGSDTRVIEERWRRQKKLLEGVAWRSAEHLYEMAEQGDRDGGKDLVILPDDRGAKVRALTQVRNESVARLESLPLLASFLEKRDISPVEYLREVQQRALTGESLAVVDARQ